MTNKEAIEILKEVQAEFNENWVDYSGVNKAFNLAFEALESQAFAYDLARTKEIKRQGDLNKINLELVVRSDEE